VSTLLLHLGPCFGNCITFLHSSFSGVLRGVSERHTSVHRSQLLILVHADNCGIELKWVGLVVPADAVEVVLGGSLGGVVVAVTEVVDPMGFVSRDAVVLYV